MLTLDGEWRGNPGALPDAPTITNPTDIRIDAQALRSWDAGLASSLWQQLDPLARRQMRLEFDQRFHELMQAEQAKAGEVNE